MAEAGPFVEWPDVDREGLKRNRKKVHSIEHLYHQTLVRDYPLHLERPTAVNKAIRSMHHFVLLKLVINDDGSVDAIIQHLNQPAFGGAIALFTVTVTNQPYIKERLIKDIDEGLYIVEHDVIDTENVHFRAALTIDRKGYVLGWYNCEAYAEFLMTGTAHSYQTMEESSPGKDVAVAAFHEFQNLLATLIRSLTSSSGGAIFMAIQKSLILLASTAGEDFTNAVVKGLRSVVNFAVSKGSTWATMISRGALALGIVVALVIEIYTVVSSHRDIGKMDLSEEDRWKAVGENYAAFGGGITAIVASVTIGLTCAIPLGIIGALVMSIGCSFILRWLFRASFRAYINRHHYYSKMRREALPQCFAFLKWFEKEKKVEAEELRALVSAELESTIE